ncbi:MAG TPA: DNA-3-methyladenine glycosylase I, partial [Thermoanaerobaculia bacterium]|nr:DNA-3-methyladenine glycosylase I [Thermoanaerobaculia bacterium]
AAFRLAFDDFSLERVARFDARRKAKLLANPGIIRNRLKVDAAVENAKGILALRKSHGSFAQWLDAHHPRSKEEWVKLFRKTFVFTGGEITGSFLLSTGYLPGAHESSCPVHARTVAARAAWATNDQR